MNDKQKSWRALGLLALAMTAGAIRFGDGADNAAFGAFVTSSANETTSAHCDSRLDPAWFGDCLDPGSTLIAGR